MWAFPTTVATCHQKFQREYVRPLSDMIAGLIDLFGQLIGELCFTALRRSLRSVTRDAGSRGGRANGVGVLDSGSSEFATDPAGW